MSKTNPKIDVSKFSNMPAVKAAMKRAAAHLVPTADELARHAEQDRHGGLRNARLRNVAHVLAHSAANALEPDAGQPIDDATRERLAADIFQALAANLPPLRNLVLA